MTELTYKGKKVVSREYGEKDMHLALYYTEKAGIIFAAKQTGVPTGIIALWCRMADVDYELPISQNLTRRLRKYIRRDLRAGYDPEDIALWHGVTPYVVQKIERDAHPRGEHSASPSGREVRMGG